MYLLTKIGKVLFEPHASHGGADLRFYQRRYDEVYDS